MDKHGKWGARVDWAMRFGRHPILLPTNHPFTALAVMHCHEMVQHAGVCCSQFSIVRGRYFFESSSFDVLPQEDLWEVIYPFRSKGLDMSIYCICCSSKAEYLELVSGM